MSQLKLSNSLFLSKIFFYSLIMMPKKAGNFSNYLMKLAKKYSSCKIIPGPPVLQARILPTAPVGSTHQNILFFSFKLKRYYSDFLIFLQSGILINRKNSQKLNPGPSLYRGAYYTVYHCQFN